MSSEDNRILTDAPDLSHDSSSGPTTERESRRPNSASASGRSTPNASHSHRSNESTPTESRRTSRGRPSLEASAPATKRARTSDAAARQTRVSASKITKKKTCEPKQVVNKKSVERGRHSRANSMRQVRSASTTKSTKRKLDLQEYEGPQTKKVSSKSRGGELSQLKQSEMLLLELAENVDAWPFARPVTKREAPDYHTIIKTPMDFQTMKAKMNKFEYMEPSAILEDLRLIFENCERYNVPDATEYLAGQRLCRYFVKRVKEMALTTVLTDEAPNSMPKQNGTGRGKACLKDGAKGRAKTSAKGNAKGHPKMNGGAPSKLGGRYRSGRRT